MAVTTVAEFFAILGKSKLLNPGQLTEAHGLAGESSDTIAVAKILAKKGLISRWQAGQLLAGRGTFFLGKYRLIELLGRGGMGSVFLGEHVTMNRRVALKIISRQFGHDPASLERFLAEARAIASLDHPNIVQAYSVDNEGDRYYLVMEYVEGMDLQQLVEAKGRLDCEQAIDFIRQAADGLEHAHQRNMIHCDIKPSNLLINPQGVVKILDMGLAKLTDGNKKPVDGQDARVLGSVDYLSPEQALNSPDLDARADIYSLGCTFYFLLTGHAPFPEGSLHERILKHQTQTPKSILAERSDVPAELADLCMKMMAKQPHDRCQTAAEVSLKLAEWQPSSSGRSYELPSLATVGDSSGGWLGADFGKDPGQNLLDLLSAGVNRDGDLSASDAAQGGAVVSDFASVPFSRKRRSTGLFATPQQTLLVCGAAAAVVVVIVALIVLVVGPSDRSADTAEPRSAHNPSLSSISVSSSARPESPKTEPPKAVVAPQSVAPTPSPQQEPPKTQVEPARGPAQPPKAAETTATAAQPAPESPKTDEPQLTLANAVDLLSMDGSPTDRGKAVPLGKVHLPPGESINVSLLGGREADDAGSFAIQQEETRDAAPNWVIRFDPRSTSYAQRQDVARIVLNQEELSICWMSPVVAASANPLRNCLLDVSVGGRNQKIGLCRPQTIDPILFVLDAAVLEHTLSWERPLSCEFVSEEMARLQITGFSGPFADFQIKSEEDTISANDAIEASPTDPKLPPTLLRVEFKVSPPFVTINVGMYWQGPNRNVMSPIRPREVDKQRTRWLNKKMGAANLPLASQKQAVKQADEWLTQLNALNELCNAANNTAKVHFRVFHEVGDRQVDLFVTPPPTPKSDSPAPAKPAAEKDKPAKPDKKR